MTFEYRPGAQHVNADGMSRQCQRPDCPVSATDSPVLHAEPETEMVDQPFAASEMVESMDADLLPELSGKTWVASALMEELTVDLLQAASNVDLILESRQDATLATVREWLQSGATPAWAECARFSPELCCWRLQLGNLSIAQLTRTADYAGAGHRRRRAHNRWSPGANVKR